MVNPQFKIYSPTIDLWRARILAFTAYLVNTQEQMQAVLEETREDIDNQFDEKQDEWKPNKRYTRDKKKKNQKDLRILHETKEGEGIRLRDVYKTTGKVNDLGVLEYAYPSLLKPYAKDLDKGVVDKKVPKAKRGTFAGKKSLIKRDLELDKEFGAIFGFDFEDVSETFKKPRKPRKRRKK